MPIYIRPIKFNYLCLNGLMQHTRFRDNLIFFRLIDIPGQRGNEQRREDREDNQHDDQLHECETAFFVSRIQYLEKFLLPNGVGKFVFS